VAGGGLRGGGATCRHIETAFHHRQKGVKACTCRRDGRPGACVCVCACSRVCVHV